jgi:hypothetical protein
MSLAQYPSHEHCCTPRHHSQTKAYILYMLLLQSGAMHLLDSACLMPLHESVYPRHADPNSEGRPHPEPRVSKQDPQSTLSKCRDWTVQKTSADFSGRPATLTWQGQAAPCGSRGCVPKAVQCFACRLHDLRCQSQRGFQRIQHRTASRVQKEVIGSLLEVGYV